MNLLPAPDSGQTLFAAGTPPDIYRYLQEITPIITVSQKALHLQLDDYIAADAYDLSDFRPDAVRLYQWEGKTFALPRDYGNQNLFYNVDIFEEAGVEPPPVDGEESSFTFEVFLDMLQRLVKREGDRVTQWGFLVNRGQRPWASCSRRVIPSTNARVMRRPFGCRLRSAARVLTAAGGSQNW